MKEIRIGEKHIPSVFSKGFIGEGFYKSKNSENKITKEYSIWSGMLKRCYYQNENSILYSNCTVSEDWLNFQNFAIWYENNHKKEFQLDKDILFKGNKVYSPETCCFVPQEINKLFTKSDKLRGELPIGVSKYKNKFRADFRKNGATVYLGIYDTPEEAFEAYKIAKEAYIRELAEEYKNQITEACYQALINYKVEITD